MAGSSRPLALCRQGLLGLVVAFALLGAPAARADGLHLYSVPLRVVRPIGGAEAPLRLRVHVLRPEQLAARLGGEASARKDAVELLLSESHTLPGVPEARHLAPSFVVDWNEPALENLRAALVAEHGERPALEALRAFAGRSIPQKTLERGWDLASVVARSGAGDCTEHAVLLAALARSVGRPARVVVGVLLGVSGEGIDAFGHAWAEVHDGAAWRLLDATPVAGEEEIRIRYLPIFALEDEGPGFSIALVAATQALWVQEIEVLGTR
jgi:transglutaminase-like putative cysteine protease